MNDIILSSISLQDFEKTIRQIVASELQKHEVKPEKIPVDFITRQEASKILGVSLPTLADWSKQGIIKSYRISTRVRYRRDEIEASLQTVKTIKHARVVSQL